eukprot:scaffold214417_cov22-Tisochrysis_lutea.AAC.1
MAAERSLQICLPNLGVVRGTVHVRHQSCLHGPGTHIGLWTKDGCVQLPLPSLEVVHGTVHARHQSYLHGPGAHAWLQGWMCATTPAQPGGGPWRGACQAPELPAQTRSTNW